jgi:hypothetical protein
MPCVTAECDSTIDLVVDDGYGSTSTRSSIRSATMKTVWRCAKCGWSVPLATELLDELARQTAHLDR